MKNFLDFLLKKINPDYIFIFSGISSSVNDNPLDVYETNVLGVLNIVSSLKEFEFNPKKILIASSASVYENSSEKLSESHPKKPISHYGNSKLVMENMILNYKYDLNLLITRPFNYFGFGQNEFFVIPKIIKHFLEKKQTIELGNTNVYREFNYINDVCCCYYELMKINSKSGTIVNLSSENKISLLEVIDILKKLFNKNILLKSNNDFVRSNEINILRGCNKNLIKLIGYNPFRTSINDALLDYVKTAHNEKK